MQGEKRYEIWIILHRPLFKKVNLINHPTYKSENGFNKMEILTELPENINEFLNDLKKDNIYNIFGWKIDNITIKKESYLNKFTNSPRNEEGYFLYI